jgi:hypothetical protein
MQALPGTTPDAVREKSLPPPPQPSATRTTCPLHHPPLPQDLDTDRPTLRLSDGTVLQGEYEESLGSIMLFEQEQQQQQQPQETMPPLSVSYKAHTESRIVLLAPAGMVSAASKPAASKAAKQARPVDVAAGQQGTPEPTEAEAEAVAEGLEAPEGSP